MYFYVYNRGMAVWSIRLWNGWIFMRKRFINESHAALNFLCGNLKVKAHTNRFLGYTKENIFI